jgi:flagellar hook-length control protein FliK
MMMSNNFSPEFSGEKINMSNNFAPAKQGAKPAAPDNTFSVNGNAMPESLRQNSRHVHTAAGNFKNILNRASDKGYLSGEGEPVKNKHGDKNNKHHNFGFALYAEPPLNTDKKQNPVILSSDGNGKDSGGGIKGNEASNGNGSINILSGNKKSAQNPGSKDNFSGGNNTLSESGTAGANKNDINPAIITDSADSKISPNSAEDKNGNKNDNKKIDGNADTANIAGTQTNLNRKSNLSLSKQASDNSINPDVNITDNTDNIPGKRAANSLRNNKELNNSNRIVEDKKNINSEAAAGNGDIKNRLNTGLMSNIKHGLTNITNFTVQNYETKLDLARSNLKNDNNLTINKSIDFLNNAGLSNSNSGNLNGNNAGTTNSGSGQINVNGLNNIESSESSGKIAINSVMFMVKRNIQSATITLKPPSLGNVRIDIVLKNLQSNLIDAGGGKAITINMLAQNDAAKNMLQSSSSNLQNALKGQGFSSINLNINLDSGKNNQNGGNNEEINKNQLSKNYSSGSVNGGKAVSGGSFSGFNMTRYNPDAIIDYFI